MCTSVGILLNLRSCSIAYDNATAKWNEAGALSFTSPTTSSTDQGPMPMEVDRLQQKGKDKGKSKGKEQKGKSKGKVDKGKDKGKGKSDGGAKNGKGKGGKEKGGKGKGTSELCWTCGKPGHMSKDCWRVRQVEAPPAPSMTSSSQQGSMTATTTTSTTSGGDGASKAIRRVSQPAVFDLRETALTGSIRMIQESPRSSVEFYSIATDEEDEDEQDMDYVINTIQKQSEDMDVDDPGSENEETINVIVSLFPGHLMGKGKPVKGVCPYLQDAQGTKIQTYGHSDVDIVMHSKEGREVIVKERVTFSDLVSQPILSYGRLLRTGWSIDGKTQCLKHDEIEIPLAFQNQSVVVRAHIRMIHEPSPIRTLKVRLGSELQETAVGRYGWQKKGDFWLGVHSSRHYQTPQFVPGFKDQVEGLCRSTLVERRGQWELVEMAEPLDGLWEQEEPIEELKEEERSRVMTFIASSGTVPETFGFEVMDGFHFKPSPEGMEELAVPEAMEDEEVEGVDIPGGERVHGASLEDQEARLEIGVAVPSQLQVNGIVLTLDSPLRSLRAACAFYRIGQSGGKQKRFNRLMAHQHQLELLMARDLAAQGRAMDERIPVEQASAREPTVEERRRHELTHLPYQPWCTACLKHRARQDQHRRTGKSHEQGCPTVSFDFCYVKSSGSGAIGEEAEDGAQAGLEVERGALLLIAVCSQTGYLLALPVKSKNQMSLITHELLAFTQVLGHEEVQYYSDNEPTLRQILKLLANARSSMGLKTTMRTTKIYDSAGNGLVENAIQRIRSLAATLMEDLAERIELRFQSQHPIWSWACRHSAWLINRFQPFHGSTSYELAHGRSYEGKLCNFGEICFAYCKPKQGFKADPKWRIGIYLGKTEIQDNWVIGDVNRVYLSRSMRRMADASKKNLMCYKGFTAYSWEYQQNFGGRIVPSKRMASMVGMPMSQALPPSSGVSPDDVDAQEILAFVKSYAGKREEAKDLIDEAPAREKGNGNDGPPDPEERKLAEDKRKDYVEEEMIPELVKVTSPMAVDEGRNQAGPSNPHHRHLHAPSTPRSTAQKTLGQEHEEVEGKKMKMTIEKPTRQLEAPTPDPKRLKHQEEPNTERRVEITQVHFYRLRGCFFPLLFKAYCHFTFALLSIGALGSFTIVGFLISVFYVVRSPRFLRFSWVFLLFCAFHSNVRRWFFAFFIKRTADKRTSDDSGFTTVSWDALSAASKALKSLTAKAVAAALACLSSDRTWLYFIGGRQFAVQMLIALVWRRCSRKFMCHVKVSVWWAHSGKMCCILSNSHKLDCTMPTNSCFHPPWAFWMHMAMMWSGAWQFQVLLHTLNRMSFSARFFGVINDGPSLNVPTRFFKAANCSLGFLWSWMSLASSSSSCWRSSSPKPPWVSRIILVA